MKDRAANCEDSTRTIFASGVETMSNSSISALPKFDYVKRTIRRIKPLQQIMSVKLHWPRKSS